MKNYFKWLDNILSLLTIYFILLLLYMIYDCKWSNISVFYYSILKQNFIKKKCNTKVIPTSFQKMKCLSRTGHATDQRSIWRIRISVRKLTQKCKRFQTTKITTWASSTLFLKLYRMMTPKKKKIVPLEHRTMLRPRIRTSIVKHTHQKFKRELLSLTLLSLILRRFQMFLAQIAKNKPIKIKLLNKLRKIHLKWAI